MAGIPTRSPRTALEQQAIVLTCPTCSAQQAVSRDVARSALIVWTCTACGASEIPVFSIKHKARKYVH